MYRRHSHLRGGLTTATFLATALSCHEDSTSPAGLEPPAAPVLATAAGAPLAFRQISTSEGFGGNSHTCGVTTEDTAYCWGSNVWGELGIGTTPAPDDCGNPCSTRPIAVLGGLHFSHVTAGDRFTCGVTTDNHAYCWGRNVEGQLGDGTKVLRPKPVPVAGGHLFRQVRAADTHTCAVTTLNVGFCWGWNGEGELGDGTTTQRLTPVRIAGSQRWRQLNGSHVHTCGVTTTFVAYCWGSNPTGALGDGTTTPRLRPAAVSGGFHFRQIDAGSLHTCAVSTADRAYCWGANGRFGPLGDGTTSPRLTPTPVFGQRSYVHVMAGFDHSCGVTMAARGLCWGANGVGQLGTGTIAFRRTPTLLGVDLSLEAVSAGKAASCAVTTGHRAYCWGENADGQLGDGTTANRLLPVAVAGPS